MNTVWRGTRQELQSKANPFAESLKPSAAVIDLMPKAARKGRKFRRYLRGNIDQGLSLSTLAGDTGIVSAVQGTVTESAWISSVKMFISMTNYTPVAAAGPIQVWIAHSDYSLAEIEEYIEEASNVSWDEGDMVSKEIMSRGRRIKMIGQFSPEGNAALEDTHVISARPITTKLGFVLNTGKTVTFVFYNSGSAALTTTSPACQMVGHANLWPM